MVRVMVVDDEALVRSGLRMILGSAADIGVVATCEGSRAIDEARSHQPDVVLLDIRMPDVNGLTVLRELNGWPRRPVVAMLTTFDADEFLSEALHSGAAGFLLKDAGPTLLTQAIHAAADGDALIAPSVTVRLLAAFAHAQPSAPRQPLEPLTAREEEVLVPVAQGRTNNEIAGELYITPSTVKAHVASLMRKLGARNRVEVAMWAHETGRI